MCNHNNQQQGRVLLYAPILLLYGVTDVVTRAVVVAPSMEMECYSVLSQGGKARTCSSFENHPHTK